MNVYTHDRVPLPKILADYAEVEHTGIVRRSLFKKALLGARLGALKRWALA